MRIADGSKESTVRWHMRHIFAKLGITPQVELVQRVLAVGVSDLVAEAVFVGAHCAFFSLNPVNPLIWVATGRACCRSFPTTPLLGLGSLYQKGDLSISGQVSVDGLATNDEDYSGQLNIGVRL